MNMFYWILTEIFQFKNMKIKIKIFIYFSLYCYHFFINYYITGTIKYLGYSALIQYIVCQLTCKNGKDI